MDSADGIHITTVPKSSPHLSLAYVARLAIVPHFNYVVADLKNLNYFAVPMERIKNLLSDISRGFWWVAPKRIQNGLPSPDL